MLVVGMRLAVGTEVCVVANGTLVAIATDVRLVGLAGALRSIAVDTVVERIVAGIVRYSLQSFVDGNEAMTRVIFAGSLMAAIAKVPIRAVETLVSDTNDFLLTISNDHGLT